jgi:hypothetical protein
MWHIIAGDSRSSAIPLLIKPAKLSQTTAVDADFGWLRI